MNQQKICPHCGAQLPDMASFCPHCAQSVTQRREFRPPRRLPRRVLRGALLVLVLGALAVTAWNYTRPKIYDNGAAEVIYTDSDGSYQLLLNHFGDRFQPMTDYAEEVEEGTTSNKPSRLFINHMDTGVNAKEVFLRKVETINVELLRGGDSPEPWQYTQPQASDYDPEAASRSILTYTDRSGDMELRWTIRMRNGDTIRLYQRMELGVVPTRHFYPEDVQSMDRLLAAAERAGAVMCTDLSQAMLDRAEKKAKKRGVTNISFTLRDLTALPEGDGMYDVVIAANVLHLLPQPEKALGELWRVTAPGGRLILPTYLQGEATAFARLSIALYQKLGFRYQRSFTLTTYRNFLWEQGLPARVKRVPGRISVGLAVCEKPL